MPTPRAILLGDQPEHLNEAHQWLAAALEVIGYRYERETGEVDNSAGGDLVTGFHWDTSGGDYVRINTGSKGITVRDGAQYRTFTGREAAAFDRNRHAAFGILEVNHDDPYWFVGQLFPCNDCGALTYYSSALGWYYHLDPAAAACFLNQRPDPAVGDGDPSHPGGIGCPLCDSLWASADSAEQHLRETHQTTYEEATS